MGNAVSERLVTNPDRMAQQWRVAMAALSNLFLSMHRMYAAPPVTEGPVELLIFLTVSVANVQRLMRERHIPDHYAATAVLPREWVVPISRNAIASATGLPRETVRRHIAKMIERGVLIEDSRGGVTVIPGMIDTYQIVPMLESLLAEFNKATEALLRTGAIALAPRDG